MGDARFSAVCIESARWLLGLLLLGLSAEWVPRSPSRCRALRVQPGIAGHGGFLLLGRDAEWDPFLFVQPGVEA